MSKNFNSNFNIDIVNHIENKFINLNTKKRYNLLKQISEKLTLLAAKYNYYDFLRFVMGEIFIPGKHILALSYYLQKISEGKLKRLIVNMPPRHAKSTTITMNFPSWYLGNNPDKEVIVVSYGAELSGDYSRVARENVREYAPDMFGVRLSPYKQGVTRWEIDNHKGGLTATGIGGPITGRGASLAIIDDPIKNATEAMSSTYKQSIMEWYKLVLRTRLTPDGAIIVVQTRWAKDDLAGRLIENMNKGGEKWLVLNMPAIAEADDPVLGRKKGEPLWPERGWTLKHFESIKKELGSYGWRALYQQDPIPFKDTLLKESWLQFYDEEIDYSYKESKKQWYFRGEPVIKTIAAIDPATGEGEDYTGIAVADVTVSKRIIFRILERRKLSIPEQYKMVIQLNSMWNVNPFLVEEVAYQKAIRQTLLSEGYFIPFQSVKRRKSKQVRIAEIAPFFEWGKIFILRSAKNFIEEYVSFPTGKHDDVLDACEMIIGYVRSLPTISAGLPFGTRLSSELNFVKEEDKEEYNLSMLDFMWTSDGRGVYEKEDFFVF